ncbi:MAG: DUF3617 domain-containing protein [Gammaproteobacteria bacterium]
MQSKRSTMRRAARSGLPHAAGVGVALMLTWGVSRAEEWPEVQSGLWETERSVENEAGSLKDSSCTNPIEDLKKLNRTLEQISDCQYDPPSKDGDSYRYRTECVLKNQGGVSFDVVTTSVLTMDGENAYTLVMERAINGTMKKQTVRVKRVGDCLE